MKNIRVDGVFQRVFVLSEASNDGTTRIVYIPLKSLHRQDYDRLLQIEKEAGKGSMLEQMRKTQLDNGKNALVLYDALIQVVEMKDSVVGSRLRKPEEPSKKGEDFIPQTANTRGPGRPKGAKNKNRAEKPSESPIEFD